MDLAHAMFEISKMKFQDEKLKGIVRCTAPSAPVGKVVLLCWDETFANLI